VGTPADRQVFPQLFFSSPKLSQVSLKLNRNMENTLSIFYMILRACLKHGMAKLRNGEMAKWQNGKMVKWY